ncbi:serine/threonine protein kinase [Nostoc sp. 'Lobaria pulmonaria (5183) cyanobiont']|uniref:serine/threonine protein kinase n=1 Tax=Nostoc sp. 'Lobaria pulmonaria (5183) cyanobiont' TaxID=1618022 RepID=UPI000CF33835|nr:serine/threonine-protein kinase [Nostoc sp. 'Lobaria pulmonaria (5183) cyanobiont']AVH70190.1 serine/threonine protein kinase [Nostoc sp. 'Lobaria pulmonaria (5183) cyanobiont']
MIGEILGDVRGQDAGRLRYEVQQLLGKKAGRRTLLARDLQTQELVVIKLLSFSSDFEWDWLKLFEREAETLKNLAHPSIPGYLNYFEVNLPTIKGFALVQTYIPAQTLEQCLQTGRSFTEAEVKQIAKALLEILVYLHRLYPPVIHRDIKPSNILLGERSGNSVGQVYLVDFGSVQTVLASETGTRTVVGTYGYMPPEQFGGRTVAASDLYSLGATLIYLVTGTHPADLPQKDFRIQFEQLANLSPSFSNWLKWMIEPSLERRLSSADQAIAALEKPQPTNLPTLVVGKPDGSKIQLTKNGDSLEIIVPPSGFDPSIVFTGLFAIVWNSFILFWTIGALSAPFPVNIPFALFSIPFWGAGFMMMYKFIFNLFGSIYLRLNPEQITLTWELFSWKFERPRPSPRQSVNKLVYIPKHFTKGSKDTRVAVPAQLYICSGLQKYQISGNDGGIKSEVELEWLAYELSEWLGLPITNPMGSELS